MVTTDENIYWGSYISVLSPGDAHRLTRYLSRRVRLVRLAHLHQPPKSVMEMWTLERPTFRNQTKGGRNRDSLSNQSKKGIMIWPS